MGMNKMRPLSTSISPKGTVKDKQSEEAQDDLMKSILESKIRFRVAVTGDNTKCVMVEGEVLERKDIASSLTEDMWLQVFLPKQKAEYKSSYDRPLTIEG